MYIYTDSWEDGFLDYSLNSDKEYRIRPHLWVVLSKIDNQYIKPDKNFRTLWNYLREVGLRVLAKKVLSRLGERARNKKYFSCGVGEVVEPYNTENLFLFLATNHPKCTERLVVPKIFTKEVNSSNLLNNLDAKVKNGSIALYDIIDKKTDISLSRDLFAWNRYSGTQIDKSVVSIFLNKLEEKIALELKKTQPKYLRFNTRTPIREYTNRDSDVPEGKLSAVLFGNGHFAETVTMANTPPDIEFSKIHEVDPTQLGNNLINSSKAYDTKPTPRKDETFDVYFASGYHHTHAPITVEALSRGKYAVVEKPLATTEEQLSEIRSQLKENGRKLFVSFQKRYSKFNEFAKEDLEVGSGDPISYHCIVYEIPLPKHHWYNWPNSKSRIVSNGCHWIDHFMYLNEYEKTKAVDLQQSTDGTLFLYVELENNATFSMTLTDKGSPRIGVQEHIELRSKDRTVKIQNWSNYTAENARKVIRKSDQNKHKSYELMYKDIGEKILNQQEGDSMKSLRSSELVLELDKMVN